MSQKLWSGLTTAAFLFTALAPVSAAFADAQTDLASEGDEVSQEKVPSLDASAELGSPAPLSATVGSASETDTAQPGAISETPSTRRIAAALGEVRKVGEYQDQEETDTAEDLTVTIIPHEVNNRSSATLRIQSIPVFTFLGAVTQPDPSSVSTASALDSAAEGRATGESETVKRPTPPEVDASAVVPGQPDSGSSATADASADPMQRAGAIAARLRQIYRDGTSAETITVRWDAQRERYVIQVGSEELIEMNADIILPDTTRNPAEDALQATNRLRRLLGSAPPLQDIQDRPRPAVRVSVSPANRTGSTRVASGIASWYGPGFHGNRSASGEVFNQNAMTAAHRYLPFGTQVRVTNLNTGQSVVVRINDRGPFSRGRVIDLSAGAARAIGMIGSGVAPVSLEVIGRSQTASR
ncbi:septal ring lytic transglycosylase RlpA family protein [Thermoleptolyngbya sp. M55_K2018_002]|uniref:septal ring lytic transglycosylase RlpA family protein n=1 Tax=Thermoleptolyngbya sp. M55_K2018_002 TaxID=2747808 RepID=UPI001A002268|nr:septal ring lytic transglycosylase RlpA family protein [Thermoleptolyngbya sp. M55_K2018_002]HIK41738.1 septal ring lytic transglycosylase RlpA family protein [Thermoleptolyngbya sp. M55_K2018_002]